MCIGTEHPELWTSRVEIVGIDDLVTFLEEHLACRRTG
jgi:hypothetical protein